MSRFSRLAVAIVAAATALTGLGGRPAEAAGPSVYTTPGGHIQGGRLWNTACEMYSSVIVRCRTEIWATQVVFVGGRFRSVTGWHFNNLAYLPQPRASWAANPLAGRGVDGGSIEWSSAGRRWRTECNTAQTGRGGCRSYIWTTYIAREGSRYVRRSGWVFNNLVMFSSPAVRPVSTIPAHVLDQSVLTVDGLGPLGIKGTPARPLVQTMTDYERLGYVTAFTEPCPRWEEAPPLASRKLIVTGLADVAVRNTVTKTDEGARVGMTVAQVRALYGSAFTIVAKKNYGVTQYFGSYRKGDREIQFRVLGPIDAHGDRLYAPVRPLLDTDVIFEMSAQSYTTDVSWDGC